MTVSTYEELGQHLGHTVYVAVYGDKSATVECEHCRKTLVKFINSEYEEEKQS